MTLTNPPSYSTLCETDRVARILELLSPLPPPEAMAAAEDTPNPYVNLSEFRELCFYGIPEWPGIRETAWRLLLGLLPSDKRKWPSSLAASRERYLGFVRDFLIKDPFESKPDPVDEARLLQIRRDVKRTLPELGVLHRAVPDSPFSPLTSAARRESVLMQPFTPTMTHQGWSIPEEEEEEGEERDGPKMEQEDEEKAPRKEEPRDNGGHVIGKGGSLAQQSPVPVPSLTKPTPTSRSTTNDPFIPVPIPKLELPSPQGMTVYDDDDDEEEEFLEMPTREMIKARASTLRELPRRGLAAPNEPFPNSHEPGGTLTEAVVQGKEELGEPGLGIKGRSRSRSFSETAGQSRRSKKPPPRLPLHMPVARPMEQQPQESARYSVYERLKHLAHPPPLSTPLRPPSPRRPDLHWEVVERILYLYARLNPGVGYVQGMNYLLAPIYWLFAQDANEANAANAEPDAFFCFTALMTDARDHFIPSLDGDAEGGVKASLSRLSQRLWRRDPGLRANLREKSLQPHYYAFRWCTCLCTMDWPFDDVLRIWDSLLADPERGEGGGKGFPYLADFCCAMLIACRDQLMEGTFEENLIMLQSYPHEKLPEVLKVAEEVRRQCAEDEAAERGERVRGGGRGEHGSGRGSGGGGSGGGLTGGSQLWSSATSVMGRHTPVAAEAVRRTTSVFATLTSALSSPTSPSDPEGGEGKWSGWGGPIRPRGDSQATVLSRAESESELDARLRPSAAWGLLGGGRWRERTDSIASAASTPAAYGTWHETKDTTPGSTVDETNSRDSLEEQRDEEEREEEEEEEEEGEMVNVEIEELGNVEALPPNSPSNSPSYGSSERVEVEGTMVSSISRWWGGWGVGGGGDVAKPKDIPVASQKKNVLTQDPEEEGLGRRASMILTPISSYFTTSQSAARPQSILGIPGFLGTMGGELGEEKGGDRISGGAAR